MFSSSFISERVQGLEKNNSLLAMPMQKGYLYMQGLLIQWTIPLSYNPHCSVI